MYYYFIMPELCLEVFHNSFGAVRKVQIPWHFEILEQTQYRMTSWQH